MLGLGDEPASGGTPGQITVFSWSFPFLKQGELHRLPLRLAGKPEPRVADARRRIPEHVDRRLDRSCQKGAPSGDVVGNRRHRVDRDDEARLVRKEREDRRADQRRRPVLDNPDIEVAVFHRERELARLERIPLLVCDEVGYIPFDPQAASLMFMLVSRRYERASMIVTSNKPFSAWGEIFGDDMAATAMVDRLIHHAEILSLKGDSYRLKDRDLGPRPGRRTVETG